MKPHLAILTAISTLLVATFPTVGQTIIPPIQAFPEPPQQHADNLAALRAEIRDMYDANRDGRIDEWERIILRRDVEAGDIPAPPSRRNSAEVRAFRAEILAMYDANGDSRLDQWERLILRRDIEAGDIVTPGRGTSVALNQDR